MSSSLLTLQHFVPLARLPGNFLQRPMWQILPSRDYGFVALEKQILPGKLDLDPIPGIDPGLGGHLYSVLTDRSRGVGYGLWKLERS